MLLVLPFIVMAMVNKLSEAPTSQYKKDKCSRYCHTISCKHVAEKYKNNESSEMKTAADLYKSTIFLLRKNGLGLGYKEMNLFIYVGLAPLLMSVLLWTAIRKR